MAVDAAGVAPNNGAAGVTAIPGTELAGAADD